MSLVLKAIAFFFWFSCLSVSFCDQIQSAGDMTGRGATSRRATSRGASRGASRGLLVHRELAVGAWQSQHGTPVDIDGFRVSLHVRQAHIHLGFICVESYRLFLVGTGKHPLFGCAQGLCLLQRLMSYRATLRGTWELCKLSAAACSITVALSCSKHHNQSAARCAQLDTPGRSLSLAALPPAHCY